MATCPRCKSNNVKFHREYVKTNYTSVNVRVMKNVSVRSGGRATKKVTKGFCGDCGYGWTVNRGLGYWLKQCILWLIYISFFPITLSVWFYRTERVKLSKKVRILVIAILWIVFLIWGYVTPSPDSSTLAWMLPMVVM